jgi:hypothetical protein
VGYCWKLCLELGPCKVAIKKSSVENRRSNSGVPNEQLVENLADGVMSSGEDC